ncbi:FAD-binding oxidoreductase [Microbacterium allomyrinae]|uniref:FAD-binding oxidoreductase n=1 Tax=Microbacterium allomyrinae TaxID=2830666 RepID=A0A9X1S201_9MICO|nr:FAD-binding oxidoreductase [Microbacterium allomyrinae]MCC2030720.1 FAD-binding oxidoreductase [Microbacterium allomyrinae]
MTLDELNAGIAGTVIRPGDPQWDDARRFHSGIGEPAAVIRASSVDDVRGALRYAVAERLDVMVRGGGHSAWGQVPGGITIDISALDDLSVDGTLVSIGGGARWGDVARALADHRLGISSGDTASVGVGGLTLGGGIGWMVRAWGLASDQLVGAQLVTARGDVVEVTAAAHPELLWALRGGGGNFGVVTRFDFRAHPLDGVVAAILGIEGDARPVLTVLRDVLVDAPRELTVTYMDVPAMDPSAPAGASITAVWLGTDEAAARAALAPLLAAPGVTEREFGVRAYPDILLETPEFDPDNPMPGFVGGNTLLRELDDESIERIVTFREQNPASVAFLRSLGGAYGDVAQEATAFPARDATWFAMAGAFDIPGMLDDARRAEVVAAWDAIESRGGGVYGNFTMSTDSGWVARMYPPATLTRLAAVKREWDPGNVFCRNHNVTPA